MSKILVTATGRIDLIEDVTLEKEGKKSGGAREDAERCPKPPNLTENFAVMIFLYISRL